MDNMHDFERGKEKKETKKKKINDTNVADPLVASGGATEGAAHVNSL